MIQTALLACGLLVGPSYIVLYLLGGRLRAGYSHIADSVSELLAPDAPNKIGLATLQVVYALLHVLFGLGVLDAISKSNPSTLGVIGAWTIVAIGAATIGTAIFPQDAEGTPSTRAGQVHKLLVFGVLVPAAVLSTLLVGLWSRQSGTLRGFDVHSFATVGATLVMGAAGGAMVKTRFAGLVERLAALVAHQWLFVLALRLLLAS